MSIAGDLQGQFLHINLEMVNIFNPSFRFANRFCLFYFAFPWLVAGPWLRGCNGGCRRGRGRGPCGPSATWP